MQWFLPSRKTQDQTTWATRIVGIRFNNPPIEHGFFQIIDLYHPCPDLFGVGKGDNILSISYLRLYPFNIHPTCLFCTALRFQPSALHPWPSFSLTHSVALCGSACSSPAFRDGREISLLPFAPCALALSGIFDLRLAPFPEKAASLVTP